MKKLYLLALTAFASLSSIAQNSNYDFNFYGFVRSDFYYDSRASATSCNEVFYLYPLDNDYDANGADLNETSTSGFYSFVTRLGVDVTGPNVGNAKASAKVEVDFGGYGSYNTLLRIRQAYVNLNWEKGSSLTVGQTWHPLFGSVAPSIANLSTGSPFQPFNRSPQIQYNYKTGNVKLIAAAIGQLQYTSSGVNGSSNEYIVQSCIPEIYVGFDFAKDKVLFGAGVDLISITPRTSSEYGGATYKVNERMTAVSGEAHVSYKSNKFSLSAKTLLASALDHTLLLGGYGVTSIDSSTGEQQYTAIRNTTSWINLSYGDKWKPYVFVGYTKNLGTSEALVSSSSVYGRGTDIDQLLGANIGLSYNKSHWSAALEYSSTTAWYGDINLANGRVYDTHDVSNNRVVAIFTYKF
ncbi:MAG: DcaP family trimeric outer membrane transporter [Rikenellaceae bacterium]